MMYRSLLLVPYAIDDARLYQECCVVHIHRHIWLKRAVQDSQTVLHCEMTGLTNRQVASTLPYVDSK
jgi:hypothetical protein